MKKDALKFVQNQLVRAEDRLSGYLQSPAGSKYPTRTIIVKVRQYYKDFFQKKGGHRWILMPGLRGVGKTTIMAQTYFEVLDEMRKYSLEKNRLLFIPLDDAAENLGIKLQDILDAYEGILGTPFEKQTKPIFLFIDETQYDPKWGTVLKALYDRCSQVFIFCTGSSALALRSHPDVIRRAALERLYPMNFIEYETIKNGITPITGLKKSLAESLYGLKTAKESFEALKSLQSSVDQYWTKVDSLDVKNYIEIGTFPFALKYTDQFQVYETLNDLIGKIIQTDVPRIGRLRIQTIGMMRRLLYLLADATDVLATSKLANLLGTNGITLTGVLDVLTSAECLIKIQPYGSATSSIRKPTKYCFMSPALRASLLTVAGSDATLATREGKYWEDLVALSLYREFAAKRKGNLVYDPSQNSADFILQLPTGVEIAIEVGAGQKGISQVVNTMQQRKMSKGIVISSHELALSKDERVVMIPFEIFLLM